MKRLMKMEKIEIGDYRMLVLDKSGIWHCYLKEVGKMHQDCLTEFSKDSGCFYATKDEHVISGNFVFSIIDKNMMALDAPATITDEQSMELDFFTFSMKEIDYLDIRKVYRADKVETFTYTGPDVKDRFGREFLQSYYEKKNGKRR